MITYQNLDPFFHKNAVFFLERSARKSKPHWHDAVEFVYILDGSLEFHLNGEKFTADAGDLVTVNAAEIHAFYPITEKVDYYFLVADDKFFRTNNLYTDTTYFEKKICSSQVQHLFEEIIKETEKADEYSNISTVSVLLSLFIYLNRHHASKREETQLSEQKKITLVRNTLVYLQTHFREKLTVEQVDEAVIAQLEENAADLYDVSRHFREGKSIMEIAEIAMRNIPFDAFDEIECEYLCDCSRERMLTAIGRVGEKEILSMLDEEEAEGHERSLEAVCRFCNTAYRFPEAELIATAKKIGKK